MNLDQIYRAESPRILATLIRLLGDFDLAEELLQEAFAAALEQWPQQGIPTNPRAWLISTAHHKGIDLLRRRARFDSKRDELQKLAELEQFAEPDDTMQRQTPLGQNSVTDDRLRLIFTCCHPALILEAQVALTLRTLCGLTTEQIARAFLVPLPAMAQRLVRAKQKIRDAQIPYRIPPEQELAERLEAVMLVVYLVFNEGYTATSNDTHQLCAEAIRLARLICELLPREPEAVALLALMLLHNSRHEARLSKNEQDRSREGHHPRRDGRIREPALSLSKGPAKRSEAHPSTAPAEPILLEHQDRSLWNQTEIQEGLTLVDSALRATPAGPYTLQAAIAAVHARAGRADQTDWPQIAQLYKLLLRLQPTPVVELNHAAAVAMSEGPAAGLKLLDALEARDELTDYYLLPAARADLLRRLNRWPEAANSYRQALALAPNDQAKLFLTRRLSEAESKQRTP
jgi:RNA polymerase sigma-70 factor, ECF subfamily